MAAAPQPVYPHISKDKDICSGAPCVDGTRVRVMDVVRLHVRGLTPEQIVEQFDTLHGVGDVYAALLYYEDHREEIDRDFAEQGEAIEKAERELAALARQRVR